MTTQSPDPEDRIDPALSAGIDYAVSQFDACSDNACRRAFRAVLDELEEMMPIVEDAILSQIDQRALEVVKVIEASEREVMQRIAATPVEKLVAS